GSETVLQTTSLVAGHVAPVVRAGPLRIARDARVAVVGPNGAGKTTLVRTLVGGLAPLEGYVSAAPMVRVAYLEQAQAELTGSATVLETLRASSGLDDQSARNLLARFLFRGDEVDRQVSVLSGGERARLAVAPERVAPALSGQQQAPRTVAPRAPKAAVPPPHLPRNAKASAVRRVNPMRALEARIEAMELQLRQLTDRVAQIAQSGNYMET